MDLFKIYIVEDDPFYGNLLQYHLSLNPDYEVTLYTNAKDCLSNLYLKPDVVCIDFGLPDMPGNELLNKIKAHNDALPIVVISGQEDVSVAVNLLKSGARDYIIKDDNTKDLLWQSIVKIRENADLKQEVETLKEQLEVKHNFKSIIGQSHAIKQTFRLINKAVNSNINVSITGETGTGKEVAAKAIHFNGPRKKHPFVAVNMAAIPRELLESELFGHEKGAFTGASSKKIGQFEQANNGTLFLDEIGEMELSLQAKILRTIQEREIMRVGGVSPIKFDARVIIATHKDLKSEVEEGNFREDLYYRLIGLPIELPPLRERDEDIIVLGEHFIALHCKENRTKHISLTKSAKQKMLKHNWPGNVRELKASIDLACVMCENNSIDAEDLNFSLLKNKLTIDSSGLTLKQYNQELIAGYLQKHDNNVMHVAKILDIGKSKIYNMLKEGELK